MSDTMRSCRCYSFPSVGNSLSIEFSLSLITFWTRCSNFAENFYFMSARSCSSFVESKFRSLVKFWLSRSLIAATQDSNISRGFSRSVNATFKWSLKYLKCGCSSFTAFFKAFLREELSSTFFGRAVMKAISLCIWLLKVLWVSFWLANRPKSSTTSLVRDRSSSV